MALLIIEIMVFMENEYTAMESIWERKDARNDDWGDCWGGADWGGWGAESVEGAAWVCAV
jgi:hypothetical protein